MDIELGLHDYWRILQKRKWIILFVFLTTFLSTVFYTQFQIPIYRSQALVKFEPPGTRLPGSELQNWDQWAAMQTQMKVLMSRDMIERVAQKLGADYGSVAGTYSVERVEQSNLMTISATSADPVRTADTANAVTAAYIEWDLGERSQQARKTLQDIVSRRQDVEQTLRNLEDEKRSFLEKHQLTGLSASMTGLVVDLEGRRKELLKRYTAEHPEVVKLDQRLEAARARLAQLPGQETELERLVRDVKVHEEMYITLSRQMEESKIALASAVSFVSVVSKAVVPDSPFFPNKQLNYMMGAVLGLFLAVLLAFLIENLDISISTIEEIEKILGVPVLCVIPHFGVESRWTALRTKLLRRQRYPMDTFRSMLVFHQRPKSPIIEVYHSLRANIQSQFPNKDHLVLTFTSTGVAEGKTLTAVNFAMAAAHAGHRTLLIGADIRRPVLHRIFGLPKQPGLTEVLSGKMRWEDVIRETVDFLMGEIDLDKLLAFSGIDNLKLMTGWMNSTADVVNLFSSAELPKLIAELRAQFDIVVFDCPPVLLFVDSLLIGPHTDGVVMIYKSGKMARRALKRAKDQVVAAKANIAGVVLNDMHATDMEPRYGYYYDYGHYAKKDDA